MHKLKIDLELRGILEYVIIQGYIPKQEALRIMETCDAFIHLRRKINLAESDIEGSPLKMLDYHSVGRPVIASRTSSYQYIEDKQFGVLVDAENEINVIKGIKIIIKEKDNNDMRIYSGKYIERVDIRTETSGQSIFSVSYLNCNCVGSIG